MPRRPPRSTLFPTRRSSDLGGPSLLRAAAKNFRDVLVIVDPADYPRVVEELRRDGGPSLAFRFELMRKTFAHTAAFDARSEEHTSELQSQFNLVCRLLLEKKKKILKSFPTNTKTKVFNNYLEANLSISESIPTTTI